MTDLAYFLVAFCAMGTAMWVLAMLVFQTARAWEAWKRRGEYYLSSSWRPWRR